MLSGHNNNKKKERKPIAAVYCFPFLDFNLLLLLFFFPFRLSCNFFLGVYGFLLLKSLFSFFFLVFNCFSILSAVAVGCPLSSLP